MINRNIVAIFYDLLDLTTYTDLCRRPKLIEEKLNITTEAATIGVVLLKRPKSIARRTRNPKILCYIARYRNTNYRMYSSLSLENIFRFTLG